MTDPAPILFIHYGPAAYLRQTLATAKATNPGKRVIFLGDAENRRLCPGGVEFFLFEEFARSPQLQEFRRVFVPIAGSGHRFNKEGGTERWLRFVFERWFIFRQFLHEVGIESFWTFDSDTVIAGDLEVREGRFADLDATEQCRGCCLNGFVSGRAVVDGYTEKMNELFRRPDYLGAQRERLRHHPGLAFNEMDAWQTHRDEEKLRTQPLGIPVNGEVFDDALAITDGWSVSRVKVRGRIPVKRLARHRGGALFAFRADGAPVRMVTANLSWLPDFTFRHIAPLQRVEEAVTYSGATCGEVRFLEPASEKILRTGRQWLWQIRSRTKKAFRRSPAPSESSGCQ